MRLKRIAAAAALSIAAGTAALAISTPAQAYPPGEPTGDWYYTAAACAAAGQAGIDAQEWEYYRCTYYSYSDSYVLYVWSYPL